VTPIKENLSSPISEECPKATIGVSSLPEYDGVPPLRAQGEAAYYRDLQGILQERSRVWVAYSGDERIGFGRTKSELYDICLRRGLQPHEFIVLFADEAALYDHTEIDFPFAR
jgi:hypothetical protein